MTQSIRSHQESVTIDVSPEMLYDLVSDISRTGEWSPICTSCWWDENPDSGVPQAGEVGAWFTGHNELPNRTWETRSQVVAAERGREFSWIVGGTYVRWGFTFVLGETGTTMTETWDFLPAGIAMFEEKFGESAQRAIADRTRDALDGIPKTLAAIKQIAESGAESSAVSTAREQEAN